MRAILILFMTTAAAQGGLGFSTGKSGLIYGTYTSLVYLMAVPGGWIADKFLGLRKAVLVGGILITLGHIGLSLPFPAGFYAGLALVVLGTGFLKPNISALVGELYAADDTRRDAGFSIYYMGINLGAFMSPLVVGWLAQGETFRGLLSRMGIRPELSWHFGFMAAAIGMICGLTWYVSGWKYLGTAGLYPARPNSPAAAQRSVHILRFSLLGILGLALVLGSLAYFHILPISLTGLSRAFGYALVLLPMLLFPALYLFGRFDSGEKKKLLVIMALFFGAAVFWSVFEQAGSTLTLFAERSTYNILTWPLVLFLGAVLAIPVGFTLLRLSRAASQRPGSWLFTALIVLACLGGMVYLVGNVGQTFPSSFFQSTNALFIVALTPVFAGLWMKLGRREPSSPAKFTLGLLLVAVGFGILILAARLSAQGAKVSPLWLVATYMLHTVGELCLSPVGLSAMSKLAPKRIMGLVLGMWFLAASLGNFMAGFTASLYENMALPTLFAAVTGFALVATVVMAASIKPIQRMLARK